VTTLVAALGVAIAALGDLTVPADRRPAGCAPSPSAVERENGNRVRSGLWAALPIAQNPQRSTEPKLIVEVRERLGGVPLIPDPPSLTARDAARFRLQLAEGIDEAYVAIYRDTASPALVVVYGLRFPNARDAEEFWSGARAARNPDVAALVSGAIVAAVSGPNGACRDAVAAHVLSLR
jgi:hypothetical protein